MRDLRDKIVLVTGGTRGIGREIARVLAGLGSKVALTGTRSDQAEAVAAELAAETGSEVMGLGVDVSLESSVDPAMEQIAGRWGRLDVLVNNAGITKDNLLVRMTSDEWSRVLQVNLQGVFNTTRRAVRTMMRQRSGSIVNISSVVGLTGNPGQSNYAASKAGLIGFTRSVAREYASKGVRANVVAPGFIETDMTKVLDETRKKQLLEKIPQGRLGTAADVAHAVAYLASDFSSYVTGQVLTVDGGMVM